MSGSFVCVMPVLHEVWGFARCGHASRFSVPCANRVLLLMWQELSALYLELGDHPGGYQYLHFRLRALMCGDLRGVVAETAAGSRSVASRDAYTMQKS